MPVVDQLVALLSYKVEGEADLKRFEKQLDAVEKSAQRMGRAIGVSVGAMVGSLAAAMGFLANAVIKTSAEFETLETTLGGIEGSAVKARKSMTWLADFARQTPYELAALTAAFTKLKVAGIEPTDGTLKILGDTAVATGKTLDQAVDAFTAATTGQYGALNDFGITAKTKGEQVTLSWEQNGERLSKTMKKTGGEVARFIKEMFGDRFGGAMARQLNTWQGMMGSLSRAWSDFKKMIGDAGFFETMKKHLKSILDLIDRWREEGTLEAVAKGFSYAFELAADAVAYAFGRISRAIEWIIKNWARIGPIVKSSAIAFGVLAAAMFPLTTIIGGVIAGMALLIEDFLTYLRGGDSLIGEFFKVFPAIEESLKNLFKGVGGTGIFGDPLKDLREIDALLQKIPGYGTASAQIEGNQMVANTLREFATLKLEWAKFEADCKALWNWLTTAWAGKLPMQKAFEDFTAWLNGWANTIRTEIVSFGVKLGDYILEGLKSMTQQFKDWVTSWLPEWVQRLGGGGGGSGGSAGAGGSGNDRLGGRRSVRYGGGRYTGPEDPALATADPLTRLIRYTEGTAGPDGYNTTLGHGALTGGPVNLTNMTLDEIDALQTRMLNHPNNRWNSSAVGAYQIVRTTLRGLRNELGLSGSEKYSPELQDRLKNRLIQRRGRSGVGLGNEWEGLKRFSNPADVEKAYDERQKRIEEERKKKDAPSPQTRNFLGNTERVMTAGSTIRTDRSSSASNVNVTAPVSVHVASADHAPAATARAVGRAVDRGARTAAAPSRMQASPAA